MTICRILGTVLELANYWWVWLHLERIEFISTKLWLHELLLI